MRISRFSILFAGLALVFAGCTGPEQKLGRGFNNVTELVRGGEMRRSVEQSGLFQGPEVASTTGVIHGFNRSVARTFVGAYEIITSPFPPYGPVIKPANPVFPDSYRPNLISSSIYDTDTNVGFSGGDIAPWFPASRFSIFDN